MFDPKLTHCYISILEERPRPSEGKIDYLLNTCDLYEGILLTRDIVNTDNNIMLTQGTEVEQHHIDKLVKIEKEQDESFLIYAR